MKIEVSRSYEYKHSGTKGGTTGCGFNTKEKSSHWINTSSKITCDKNGCKN